MMDWRRIRHLASGALLASSLCSGVAVGSVVLLGSANHTGDPVGRLSAHLASQSLAVPGGRGARAVALGRPKARGARAVAKKRPKPAAHVATTSATASASSHSSVQPAAKKTTTVRKHAKPTTVTIAPSEVTTAPATKVTTTPAKKVTTPVTTTPVTTTPATTTATKPTTTATKPTTTPDDWTRNRTGAHRTWSEPAGTVEDTPGKDDVVRRPPLDD
jgi:hypothetical protein